MSSSNKLLIERTRVIQAFASQAVNNSAVKGATIATPWRIGRRGLFVLSYGAMTTNDSVTVSLEKRRQGTSTWDPIKQYDGTTNMAFAAAADTSSFDQGIQLGELDFSQLHVASDDPLNPLVSSVRYEYDAIRLSAINAAAQNVNLSAVLLIGDMISEPSSDYSLVELIRNQLASYRTDV